MQGFYGQIMLFAGTYVPEFWALCDGSLLPIAGNEELYSLLGTTYGGDGVSNFGLPDLRGRVPVHYGTSSVGTYVEGELFGTPDVTLLSTQMPVHTHALEATSAAATSTDPTGNLLATVPAPSVFYATTTTPAPKTLAPDAVQAVGQNLPHDNYMPSVALSYIICVNGLFPSRP